MKKGIVCLSLCSALLLTGCGGGKTLECTYKYGDETETIKMTFDKNGEKVQTAQSIESGTLDEDITQAEIDEELADANAECKEMMKEYKGVSCKASVSGRKYSFDIKYDLSKMSNDEIEDLYLDELLDMTYESAKDEYEGYGYSCK